MHRIVFHFTSFGWPLQVFVCGVAFLTAAVVYIAHWVGLPYWWEKSPVATVFLVIFGYWLLMNVSFHYYMAVTTKPGHPPDVSSQIDCKNATFWLI